MKVKSLSRVLLFTTPWTAAHQAPPSTGFSRQEYWSGVPSPSPFPCHRNTLNYTATCCHKFFQVNDPKIKKRKAGRQREREREGRIRKERKQGGREGGREREEEREKEAPVEMGKGR